MAFSKKAGGKGGAKKAVAGPSGMGPSKGPINKGVSWEGPGSALMAVAKGGK